jgi:cytochrome P450
VLGRDSLLVIDGEHHLRTRKLLLPPFHGPRIADHEAAMVAAAEDDLRSWPVETPFALQPRMQAMTLDVILRAVFGLEAGERRDRFRVLLARLLELNTTMATTLPLLRKELFGLSPWGRLMKCTKEVDRELYAEIDRRRAEGDTDKGDVLSLLLSAHDEDGEPMSDSELRDQLLTMLVAGHETTATALAWAFERLLREPRALARTRAEVDGGSTTYLDAVIKETLRLRPTVPIAARKLTKDQEVGGRRYAKGTVLMPCIHLLHRNPKVWHEPEAFRPERFLEGAKPAPYSWIPFGGGVRRCLGSGFALVEMRAVMATVLQRMDLRVAERPGERVERRAFTLSPGRGARVIATPRA